MAQKQISGRALRHGSPEELLSPSNKNEVIHQALALLDAVTRGNGPEGASFRNADELEALLLQAGPASPMTAERKARIYGNLKR